MWETQAWSLGWDDPLEKGMATHSSILAWKIPWTEDPGRLQSMRPQRVGHNWMTNTSLSHMCHGYSTMFQGKYTMIFNGSIEFHCMTIILFNQPINTTFCYKFQYCFQYMWKLRFWKLSIYNSTNSICHSISMHSPTNAEFTF